MQNTRQLLNGSSSVRVRFGRSDRSLELLAKLGSNYATLTPLDVEEDQIGLYEIGLYDSGQEKLEFFCNCRNAGFLRELLWDRGISQRTTGDSLLRTRLALA